MDDVSLVTRTYEQCWHRSRGQYNAWIEGQLHPRARAFYIAVNAVERCLMGGVPSLLEERRFTLEETAATLDGFEFARHASVVRQLATLGSQLSPDDVNRLNAAFPTDEDAVWKTLAAFVREHPEAFAFNNDE